MKTVIYNKFGGPEVMEIAELKKPSLPENKILVKVVASSVNPVDYKIRRGDMKLLTGKKFPRYAGSDFAGVVEETGGNVAGYRTGDEVYGFLNPFKGGAYSEYIVVNPLSISLKSDKLSFEEAAVLPIAALTALQSLTYLGDIKEGDSVLINGATGGVGTFAVQIAKGLDTEVTGICSADNMEFCKQLGADFVYDYSEQELEMSKKKFDIIFDVAGKMNFSKSKRLLNKNGVFVSTLPKIGIVLNGFLNFLPKRKKAEFVNVKSAGIDLAILTGFVAGDMVKPIIEHSFGINDICEAYRFAENRKFRGKIAINI